VLTRARQRSPTLFLSLRYILIPFSHVNRGRTSDFFQPNLHRQLPLHGYRNSFLGVKWRRRYTDHSPPSSAEVKNERISNPTPLHTPSRLGQKQLHILLLIYVLATSLPRVPKLYPFHPTLLNHSNNIFSMTIPTTNLLTMQFSWAACSFLPLLAQ